MQELQEKRDRISTSILTILAAATEPLETKEVQQLLNTTTRVKILYRLNRLRGDRLIKGKQIGSGKGTWIWWDISLFEKESGDTIFKKRGRK